MASVRQKTSSQFWYACITGTDGKQRQFSTGKTERTEALALAVAAERAIRRPTASQVRASLMRLMEEFDDPQQIDAGPYLRQWVAGKSGSVSPATFASYSTAIKAAAEWLEAEGLTSLHHIDTAHLVRMRDSWPVGLVTKNSRTKILRIAFLAAHRAGHITTNPATALPILKTQATLRREFRHAELSTLLATVTGEWRALTLLGLYTGQRINDLAALRWSAIDMQAATIHLTTAKTKRLVSLPLVSAVLDVLAELPTTEHSPTAYVLPGIASLRPSSRSNQFHKILVSCGLATPSDNTREARRARAAAGKTRRTNELSFHSLRHTATTLLKAAGVSDSIARAIIGHESAAVSRAYTHLDLDTIRQAMAKLPSL